MSMLALFGSFGGQEILVILVLILLLFGAKRLPELARSLGQGIKEFRKSVKEISEDSESEDPGSGRKSS
jgi:sec-independent protein translocase protein TatA